MKALSQRERIMVTALPAAVLLLGYHFLIAGKLGKERDDLESKVDTAQSRIPSLKDEVSVAADLAALKAESIVLVAAAKDLKEKQATLQKYWGNQDSKIQAGKFVSDLLTSKGIILIEEALASEADQQKFSSAFARLPDAKLWKLSVAGSFSAVSETLAALGTTDLPVLPVAIEMEPLAEGNRNIHLWSLWMSR